jgi:RimJ/RimL family protein N-acetyltransferase
MREAHRPVLRTERLILRRWRDTDLIPFAALNADARVMEFFPSRLSRTESDELAARIDDGFERRGFGAWAVEVVGGAEFIGFVGLSVPKLEASFMPCVEIMWRLDFEHWGHGYATEAARAALGFGFIELALPQLVSFTAAANQRSQRVMQRLGMIRAAEEDFDHPRLPVGHSLRRHVLYRLSREAYRGGAATSAL